MDILNTVPILNLLLLRVVPYFPKKDQRLNKKYRCSREKTCTQVSSLFEARCLELEFLFRFTYFDEKGGSSQGRKEKHYLSVLVKLVRWFSLNNSMFPFILPRSIRLFSTEFHNPHDQSKWIMLDLIGKVIPRQCQIRDLGGRLKMFSHKN